MSDGSRRPSVLVGMLHVGEPSVGRVREHIHEQADVDVELIEIAHQTKWEAHRRLFDAFTTASIDHDAVVKIDADMELLESRLLHAIGLLFRRHSDLDHLILGVDDWYSGRRIQGMNAWRRGVRWTSPPPELFTDLARNTARTKLKVMDAGRPLVLHATDPSDEQAVRYGLQRGLKAIATGKGSRIGRLLEVVNHAAHTPERGRLLAVAAIGFALSDGVAARSMLDAARDEGADLAGLCARLDDPLLCGEVSRQVTALALNAAPHETPQGPSPQQHGFIRALQSVHAVVARAVGLRADKEALREAWRADFMALLDDGQPSRSSA